MNTTEARRQELLKFVTNLKADYDRKQLYNPSVDCERLIEWLNNSAALSSGGSNCIGLEKLLNSLIHQSNGCRDHRGSERYILSGIIDYTKELIEEEKQKQAASQVIEDRIKQLEDVLHEMLAAHSHIGGIGRDEKKAVREKALKLLSK